MKQTFFFCLFYKLDSWNRLFLQTAHIPVSIAANVCLFCIQGRQLQDQWRIADQEVQKLQQLVRMQSEKADALRQEISLLGQKGGHILPPEHMLPSQSSSKRQLWTPGRIQQPQSFTGTSRKRQAKSSAHTGTTKLPVLPANKS